MLRDNDSCVCQCAFRVNLGVQCCCWASFKHTSNPLMEQLVNWASIWQVVITSCPGKQRGPARLAATAAASLVMGVIHPGVSVNMCVDACVCAHSCVCVWRALSSDCCLAMCSHSLLARTNHLSHYGTLGLLATTDYISQLVMNSCVLCWHTSHTRTHAHTLYTLTQVPQTLVSSCLQVTAKQRQS